MNMLFPFTGSLPIRLRRGRLARFVVELVELVAEIVIHSGDLVLDIDEPAFYVIKLGAKLTPDGQKICQSASM